MQCTLRATLITRTLGGSRIWCGGACTAAGLATAKTAGRWATRQEARRGQLAAESSPPSAGARATARQLSRIVRLFPESQKLCASSVFVLFCVGAHHDACLSSPCANCANGVHSRSTPQPCALALPQMGGARWRRCRRRQRRRPRSRKGAVGSRRRHSCSRSYGGTSAAAARSLAAVATAGGTMPGVKRWAARSKFQNPGLRQPGGNPSKNLFRTCLGGNLHRATRTNTKAILISWNWLSYTLACVAIPPRDPTRLIRSPTRTEPTVFFSSFITHTPGLLRGP